MQLQDKLAGSLSEIAAGAGAVGDGVQSAIVGRSTSFSVHLPSTDTSGIDVQVSVMKGGERTINASVSRCEDGSYLCSYCLHTAGCHIIAVRISRNGGVGADINGSPFLVNAHGAHPAGCTAFGDGLAHAVVGLPASFTVGLNARDGQSLGMMRRSDPGQGSAKLFSMGRHGAGEVESEGHAWNQTVPTEKNSSVYGQISAVRRRRIARRQVQRTRRKEFRQQRSANSEGRIAQLEGQVANLLEQIVSLQLRVDEIGQASNVATGTSGTQTTGDEETNQYSTATKTETFGGSEHAAQASVESSSQESQFSPPRAQTTLITWI
jgi:hypothetical protein